MVFGFVYLDSVDVHVVRCAASTALRSSRIIRVPIVVAVVALFDITVVKLVTDVLGDLALCGVSCFVVDHPLRNDSVLEQSVRLTHGEDRGDVEMVTRSHDVLIYVESHADVDRHHVLRGDWSCTAAREDVGNPRAQLAHTRLARNRHAHVIRTHDPRYARKHIAVHRTLCSSTHRIHRATLVDLLARTTGKTTLLGTRHVERKAEKKARKQERKNARNATTRLDSTKQKSLQFFPQTLRNPRRYRTTSPPPIFLRPLFDNW